MEVSMKISDLQKTNQEEEEYDLEIDEETSAQEAAILLDEVKDFFTKINSQLEDSQRQGRNYRQFKALSKKIDEFLDDWNIEEDL